MRLILLLALVGLHAHVHALDYEQVDIVGEDGEPAIIDGIKVLSVHHLFTTTVNGQDMVELSGLAWSRDENTLYAVSDHGALFHFRPVFNDDKLVEIKMLGAYPLLDKAGKPLGFPNSDSEGLHVRNASNGIAGDDELLISFELRPRLQWHRPDGGFIRKEPLTEYLEDNSSYHRRHMGLEAVTIHPQHGVLTTPEYPMETADWSLLTLYRPDGTSFTVQGDANDKMAVCAIEQIPGGDLLVLQRRYQWMAPTWTTSLLRISFTDSDQMQRTDLATMMVGNRVPVDNYEGLAHHEGNRYFMISDNNENFTQQTLLMYFELLP